MHDSSGPEVLPWKEIWAFRIAETIVLEIVTHFVKRSFCEVEHYHGRFSLMQISM